MSIGNDVTISGSEFAPLDRLFNAKSLAVVGASADLDKIGGRPLRYLKAAGFTGEIHPVNPRYTEIMGLRCSPSLVEIGRPVDVAIIAVPGQMVEAAIDDCVSAGVPFAIIFSSGFGEVGAEGRKRQESLVRRARVGGVRIIGPNSLGIASSPNNLMASFATLFDRHPSLLQGSVGFISQSGALGVFIYALAEDAGLGFSRFVSIGNESDIDVADFLAYMALDPATTAIGGYLEGISDGPRFLRAAELARSAGKVMSFLKVGRSEAGRRAAESHTGSIAGADAIYDAALRQAGIVRASDPQSLVDFLHFHGSQTVRPGGSGVAVLTISGGAGVWCADRLADLGIDLADLSSDTVERLREVLPPFATPQNPVDATGQLINDPKMFESCLQILLDDQAVGTLVVILGLQERGGENFAQQIVTACRATTTKLVVVAWLAAPNAAISVLREASIPVFGDLSRAIQVVAESIRANAYKIRTVRGINDLIQSNAQREYVGKTEFDAKQLLRDLGIETPPGELCHSVDEAVIAARKIGFPIALKGQVLGLVHKTEHSLVQLGLSDEAEVREGFQELQTALRGAAQPDRVQGVLVEKMAPAGLDVVVGCVLDDVFGPTVMFGLGGIHVELFKDVAFRIAPITVEQALEMMQEIRASKLMDGFRGSSPFDHQPVAQILSRLSRFAFENQETIREIEINPVRVHSGGAVALDALVTMR